MILVSPRGRGDLRGVNLTFVRGLMQSEIEFSARLNYGIGGLRGDRNFANHPRLSMSRYGTAKVVTSRFHRHKQPFCHSP